MYHQLNPSVKTLSPPLSPPPFSHEASHLYTPLDRPLFLILFPWYEIGGLVQDRWVSGNKNPILTEAFLVSPPWDRSKECGYKPPLFHVLEKEIRG